MGRTLGKLERMHLRKSKVVFNAVVASFLLIQLL